MRASQKIDPLDTERLRHLDGDTLGIRANHE